MFERKIIHIAVGSVIALLWYLNYISAIHIFYLLLISSAVSLIHKYKPLPILKEILEQLSKEDEKNFPGKGFITFLIGVLITMKLFSKDIALASIMILTFGDSLSHIFSTTFPKPKLKIKKLKSIFGVLLSFLFSFLFASFFVEPILAFFGSLSAIILELFEIKIEDEVLDDNVMIPLVSGTIMLLIRYHF
ncbi:MAG: hypothetical protein QXS41_00620 [Candidatus Woesearchaeota archaeon]